MRIFLKLLVAIAALSCAHDASAQSSEIQSKLIQIKTGPEYIYGEGKCPRQPVEQDRHNSAKLILNDGGGDLDQ